MTRYGDSTERFADSLPPVDGGIRAWRFLAAAFVVEALVWVSSAFYGSITRYSLRDRAFRAVLVFC